MKVLFFLFLLFVYRVELILILKENRGGWAKTCKSQPEKFKKEIKQALYIRMSTF